MYECMNSAGIERTGRGIDARSSRVRDAIPQTGHPPMTSAPTYTASSSASPPASSYHSSVTAATTAEAWADRTGRDKRRGSWDVSLSSIWCRMRGTARTHGARGGIGCACALGLLFAARALGPDSRAVQWAGDAGEARCSYRGCWLPHNVYRKVDQRRISINYSILFKLSAQWLGY